MQIYPKDYQPRIDIAQQIIEQASELDRIELPTHEDISHELTSVQKDINSAGSNLLDLGKALLDNIQSEVQEDLDNALQAYRHEINNYEGEDALGDMDAFPYRDWMNCAKFEDKRYQIQPTFSWFLDANKFSSMENGKKDLYLYNLNLFFQEAYQANIHRKLSNNKLVYLLVEAQKYLEKEDKLEVFHHIFYNEKNNTTNLNGWNKLSIYHLCASWNHASDRLFAFNKLKEHIKQQDNDFKQEVINILFGLDNGLYNLYKYRSGTQTITQINWDIVKEFLEIDVNHKTNLASLVFTKLEHIAEKYAYAIDKQTFDLDYAQALALYNKLMLDKKLSKNEEHRTLRKI